MDNIVLSGILFVGIICAFCGESLQTENVTTTAIRSQVDNFTAGHRNQILSSFTAEMTPSKSSQEKQIIHSSTDSSLAEAEHHFVKDTNDAWSAGSSSQTYSDENPHSLLIPLSLTEVEYQDDDFSHILITTATEETNQAVFEYPAQTGYIIFPSEVTHYSTESSSTVTSLPIALADSFVTDIQNANHAETNFQTTLTNSMMSEVYNIHQLVTAAAESNTTDVNIYDEPHVTIIFDENFQQMVTNTSDEDYLQDFGGIYHNNHSQNSNDMYIFNISEQLTHDTGDAEIALVSNADSPQMHEKSTINVTERIVTLISSMDRGYVTVHSNDELTSITTSIADQEDLPNISLGLTVIDTKNYMLVTTTIMSDRETREEIVASHSTSSHPSMEYRGNEYKNSETDIQTHIEVSSEESIKREIDFDAISPIFTDSLNQHKQSTLFATRNETEQLTNFLTVSSESMSSRSITVTTVFDDEEQKSAGAITDMSYQHSLVTHTTSSESVSYNPTSGENIAIGDNITNMLSSDFSDEQAFELNHQPTSKDISPVLSTNIFMSKLPEETRALTISDDLISVTYPEGDIVLTPSYVEMSDRNYDHITTVNMQSENAEISGDNTYSPTEELSNIFKISNFVTVIRDNSSEQTGVMDEYKTSISYNSSRESPISFFVIQSSFGQASSTEISASDVNNVLQLSIKSASTSDTLISSSMPEMPTEIFAYSAQESEDILSQDTVLMTEGRTVSDSYSQVTDSSPFALIFGPDLNMSSYQGTSSKDFASSESTMQSLIHTGKTSSIEESINAFILPTTTLTEKFETSMSSSSEESSFLTQNRLATENQELTVPLSSSWLTPSLGTIPRETATTDGVSSSAPYQITDHFKKTIPCLAETITSRMEELSVIAEQISASVLSHDSMSIIENISYTHDNKMTSSHSIDSRHFSQTQSTSPKIQQENYESLMSDTISNDTQKYLEATHSVLVSLSTVEEKTGISSTPSSSEMPGPSETSQSTITLTSDDSKMDTTTDADQQATELQTTKIPATHQRACKYDQEFSTGQSEVTIPQTEFDSLTKHQMNNTITVVFNFTKDREWIELYTKNFNKWMIKMLLAEIKHNMKSHSQGKSNSDITRIDLIYILPSPNVFDENLIFTFFGLISPENDTVPIDSIIEALLSDPLGMQNCINLNLTYYIRGRHRLPNDIDTWESLNQVWQKYGVLLLTVSMLTLLIVMIMAAAVIYLRCKSRRSVAYISDLDRLHNDNLHVSTEIGDLNRGSIILQDEICEKDACLVNGSHVHTIGDDEGWLVPINDVPLEDKDAPDIQDTKL